MAGNKLTNPALTATRTLQWISAVIVMGITSYFIHRDLRGEHSIYIEVISTMSVVFFLPAFASIFKRGNLSLAVLVIDIIFSYLWLTAFIFAAQDYNWHHNCTIFRGASCSKNYAQEAFIFLAFFFTFTGIGLELWFYRTNRRNDTALPLHEKRHSDAEAAPVQPAVAGNN